MVCLLLNHINRFLLQLCVEPIVILHVGIVTIQVNVSVELAGQAGRARSVRCSQDADTDFVRNHWSASATPVILESYARHV